MEHDATTDHDAATDGVQEGDGAPAEVIAMAGNEAAIADSARRDQRSAGEVVAELRLEPHIEGGYFRETYRSPLDAAGPRGPRPLCTAILYLLEAGAPNRPHRLPSDEVWFYHTGDPLELLLSEAEPMTGCAAEQGRLGERANRTVLSDSEPQVVIPAGWWQTARVLGDRWSLVACVVAPGFEYVDLDLGQTIHKHATSGFCSPPALEGQVPLG